jgi:hypothetical protein
MLSSIVHIESSNKQNKSFGTGFVIDNDEDGAYILTCQHVLNEVNTATVEEQAVEIVATSDFLDMAVVYVKALKVPALPLQLEECKSKKVHAIGFSSFSRDLVQKKQIHATLFDELIELHSKIDDSFYVVRRIKAHDDYSFERGNSGSPVICKKTGSVIAMISNKKGSNIAYAIEIASLKEIWKDLNASLLNQDSLHKHQHFYDNINNFTNKVKENFEDRKENVKKKVKHLNSMDDLQKEMNEGSKLKYYLSGIASVILALALFYFFTLPPSYKRENYKVVNIPDNDVLNIREDKGIVYPILGVIPYDAHNVAVTTCNANDAGKEWCNVTYGNVTGWVRSKYIKKEIEILTNSDDNHYFKLEEKNLFLQLTYPPSVKRGKKILVTALLKNKGNAEDLGGITLSFPQRPLLQYEIVYNDFDSFKKYGISEQIYNNHKNQENKMPAIHPVIEATQINWQKGKQHIFSLSMSTPQDLTIFRIRVRGSLTLKRVIPTNGTIDQQAFATKEIVIKIED